ncbi:hypothetical protein [Paenibacillus sp. OAS669]|uniref:hypothetical protein n=1 Tax=Paenibacillus sp. OAS669 TaxID=2663821 RepID=UPI00178B9949|nr:hypothetical protein [Paenibacillus sp. OAS669]MBE1446426.1 hypothetical protein [Paenibacillus sp. OAS669]
MIGTVRWNLIIGLISLVITFISSISTNIWTTSLLRSVYSFAIVFIVIFLFRWILGTIAGLNQLNTDLKDGVSDEEGKGAALDLQTPEDDASIHQMLKDSLDPKASSMDSGFAPLNPPKLSSKTNSMEPGEMAQAVRRMAEE